MPGHGNPNADITFVGEAPGAEEDKQGEPFIGPAGQRFNRQLAASGLRREDVFVTNTVLCRPPGNDLRAYPDAQLRCPPLWLHPVLQQIKPRVVVALGRTAGSIWMPGLDAHEMNGLVRSVGGEYLVVGSWHPSYALRSGGEWNSLDDAVVANIKLAVELVREDDHLP